MKLIAHFLQFLKFLANAAISRIFWEHKKLCYLQLLEKLKNFAMDSLDIGFLHLEFGNQIWKFMCSYFSKFPWQFSKIA